MKRIGVVVVDARAARDRAAERGRDDRRRPAAVRRRVDWLARRRGAGARGDRTGDCAVRQKPTDRPKTPASCCSRTCSAARPSNLAVTFLETDRVEVITGVNLAMLIKLARPPQNTDLPGARARHARARTERDLGGLRPDPRGERVIERVTCSVSREPAGPARAGGGEVRSHGGTIRAHIRVPQGRPRNGRQEHHGPAAARRRPRQHDHDHRRRTRRGEAMAALCALVDRGFEEASCV